jgi:hypothetical protein
MCSTHNKHGDIGFTAMAVACRVPLRGGFEACGVSADGFLYFARRCFVYGGVRMGLTDDDRVQGAAAP